jgi:ribosomal protein S18 acetylase RimI-like enzyme
MEDCQLRWRGDFTNDELNRLHSAAFDQPLSNDDWVLQVERHSLGWVTARRGVELVGFVNVAWDGRFHAFILDTIVMEGAQRQGIGTRLVEMAAAGARGAGCGSLHLDFEEELRPFYFESCGFTSTAAGLLRLEPGTDER